MNASELFKAGNRTGGLTPRRPAIDAGISGAGIPSTDQRGEGRVGAVDIGAFENQGFTMPPVPGSTLQTSPIGTPFANLALPVTANNPVEPVNGVVSFVANSVKGAPLEKIGSRRNPRHEHQARMLP